MQVKPYKTADHKMSRIVNIEEPLHKAHVAPLAVVIFDEGPDNDYPKLNKSVNLVYAKIPDERVKQNPFFHVKNLLG